MEFLIRCLAVIFLIIVILFSGKLIWWISSPYYYFFRSMFYTSSKSLTKHVRINQITIIEDGKVLREQSPPVTGQLAYRLNSILQSTKLELTPEVQRIFQQTKIQVPESGFSSLPLAEFGAANSSNYNFETKILDIDVVGLGSYLYNYLSRNDEVNVFIELAGSSTRYFVELISFDKNSKKVFNSSPNSINESIELIACDVAYLVLKDEELIKGLDRHQFCKFVFALEQYNAFLASTAERLAAGKPIQKDLLQSVLKEFTGTSLGDAQALYVLLLSSSLHKLDNNHHAAYEKLDSARRQNPDHEFIKANIEKWKKDKEPSHYRNPRILTAAGSLTLSQRERNYRIVQQQGALKLIGWDAFRELAAKSPKVKDITVAVFVTGYNSSELVNERDKRVLPTMVPKLAIFDDAGDDNGSGTELINLLLSLIPDDSVKLLPVKVFDEKGQASQDIIVSSIEETLQKAKIDVALLAFGGLGDQVGQRKAIEKLLNSGVIVIAPAGNSQMSISYPAAYEGVISVGSIDSDGGMARFSPKGALMYAPGVDVETFLGEDIIRSSGTSASAGIATAMIATTLTRNPRITFADIRDNYYFNSKRYKENGPNSLEMSLLFSKLIASKPFN